MNLHDLHLYPHQPGVYLMKDSKGRVLYIGKANNLRSRIKQYFLKQRDLREMIPYLMNQVESIDTIIVTNEKEALILENNLIKKHKPRYNVLLKDDKTYICLVLTHHKWPMLQLTRSKQLKKKGSYFGPYTSARSARAVFDLISRLFPLRQCSDTELASRTRPCLLYDIQRCIAPCMGKCTQKEYMDHVKRIQKLLMGQDHSVLKELREKMQKASQDLAFEKAQEYHKMIQQIEHVQQVQHVDNPIAQDCDAMGYFREGDFVLITRLYFREGKLVGSEHFSFTQIVSSDEEILSQFIFQHYQKTQSLPKEVFLPFTCRDQEILQELIKPHLFVPKKGAKMKLIEMAIKNAEGLAKREQKAKSVQEKRLLDLQEIFSLNRFPRKIQCLDTSHLSGEEPVAAIITLVNGQRDKKQTRLFKIRDLHQPDDYAAIYQALYRHFTRLKEENDFPDLLIVDGGKGQLNIALKIFDALNIASVDVMGLAKQDSRHDYGLTQEKVFLPHKKDPILLDKRSPILFFLQTVRDTTHKVVIAFHQKRKRKKITKSSLDTIPGIGPIKKARLLNHFKSLKQIEKATDHEILSIKGMTKKDMVMLRKFFSL